MNKLNNDIEKHLSEQDILDYLNDHLDDRQRHQLERHLLDCAFCQDAMDGLELLDTKAITQDIAELSGTLENRTVPKKKRTMWPYYAAAASVLLLITVSIVFFQVNDPAMEKNQVAMEIEDRDEQMTEPIASEQQIENPEEVETSQELIEQDEMKAKAEQESEKQSKPKIEEAVVAKSSIDLSNDKSVTKKADQAVAAQPIEEKADRKEEQSEDLLALQADLESADDMSDVALSGNEGATEEQVLTTAPLPQMSRSNIVARESFAAIEEEHTAGAGFADEAAKTVGGTVVDAEDGSQIAGVNVVVKGTTVGTLSDTDGNFEITTNEDSITLVFSFIGLETQEKTFVTGESQEVRMDTDAAQLSEVVVTGVKRSRAKKATRPKNVEPRPSISSKAYQKYIDRNLNYPNSAREASVQGKVTIQFKVQSDGMLDEFQVLDGIGYGCDQEAIRLIMEGPSWNPGLKDGMPIEMISTYSINFKLRQ